MYSTNMKLFLIKFTYAFLSFFLIIFLASCSILDYEEGQNNSKYSQNNVKKINAHQQKFPLKLQVINLLKSIF